MGKDANTLLCKLIFLFRLSLWVKGQSQMANYEFNSAVGTFRLLDDRPRLRDNADVVSSLGEAYFMNGDYSSAMATLQRVRKKSHYYDLYRTHNSPLLLSLISLLLSQLVIISLSKTFT